MSAVTAVIRLMTVTRTWSRMSSVDLIQLHCDHDTNPPATEPLWLDLRSVRRRRWKNYASYKLSFESRFIDTVTSYAEPNFLRSRATVLRTDRWDLVSVIRVQCKHLPRLSKACSYLLVADVSSRTLAVFFSADCSCFSLLVFSLVSVLEAAG